MVPETSGLSILLIPVVFLASSGLGLLIEMSDDVTYIRANTPKLTPGYNRTSNEETVFAENVISNESYVKKMMSLKGYDNDWICRNCGTENANSERVCSKCGSFH